MNPWPRHWCRCFTCHDPPMTKIAVIDIGKTNAKLALVDAAGTEISVITRANTVLQGPPYAHFDTEGIWRFLLDGLRAFQAAHGIDGISITTHGACAALLAADGGLAAPVLDYEDAGPDSLRADYDAVRPDFALTGSARLPGGLNLGAQIFWQLARDPGLLARLDTVVTWPQYWGFRLTGQRACDLCSLGCHTDLWNPVEGTFSDLPARIGIADKIAPARRPDEVLGNLLPDLQAETGIGAVPVLVGIHDSNASLLPHLMARAAPFSVISTGTWVVVMAMGAAAVTLDPARDTLINVNALGQPVPSARFMGGREYEMIREGRDTRATPADAQGVLARELMLWPSVVGDSGPFQGRKPGWSDVSRTAEETEVALGYYLALMTAECLAQIGAQGPSIVEGPFAANPWYCQMLAAATGRGVVPSTSRTGTAAGAALLFAPLEGGPKGATTKAPQIDPRLAAYATSWRATLN